MSSLEKPIDPLGFDSRLAANQVLIVILNFNGLDDTLECLESIRAQTSRDVAVLVIDNGSTSDDLARIATRFPEVEVMALPDNLGWAGGNNVGIRQALERGFGYVCLLNNDTVLDPTAMQELLAAAELMGQRCLLHPAIAYFDNPAKFQLNPPPPPASPAVRDFESNGIIVELSFAYGACLLLSASVLQTVGLFDERFFLQMEETDYFWRAKALNIGSFCARRARILHKESVSFGGTISSGKTYYQVRNTFLLAEKHQRGLRGFLGASRSIIWTLHHQCQYGDAKTEGWLSFLRWLASADPIARAARQGAGDFLRRRFGRRPT
jgi:GT2 family glycosyltransferase